MRTRAGLRRTCHTHAAAKQNQTAPTGGVCPCRANCAPRALGRRRCIRGPRLDVAFSVLVTHVDAGIWTKRRSNARQFGDRHTRARTRRVRGDSVTCSRTRCGHMHSVNVYGPPPRGACSRTSVYMPTLGCGLTRGCAHGKSPIMGAPPVRQELCENRRTAA